MKIESLLAKLREDFPDINFIESDRACWSPKDNVVYYDNNANNLIHELEYALLGHQFFLLDIELIRIERDAWDQAKSIAKKYNLEIDDVTIEKALDDYRDWIHKRSLCPKCYQTGVQAIKDLDYYCINCNSRWKANDARSCGLKRKLIKKQKTAL